MSEVEQKSNWLSKAGSTAIGIGIFVMLLEVVSGSDSGLGAACCCFGIFGAVAGSIVSSAGAAVSSDGAMVLKQNSTGQWEWMPNSEIPTPVTADTAANYNDQNTQIMSRVISEIRGGRTLQDLDENELSIIASTYGINSGSKQQKIEALHNSELARTGLKLGALGVAAGVGAVGASRIIKSGRERAIERAEELREQGREKLQENIEAGKYSINSKLPTSESGESATEVANNIVLDQLKVQIEKRGLTPEILLQIADSNKDGRLDADEIAIAMSQATGFAVPAFIVSDAMKDFDVDKDGAMDINELHSLWSKLGLSEDNTPEDIGADELTEPSDEAIEEQENLMEEEVSDEEIEAVFEEIETAENDLAVQEEARLLAEQEAARQAEEEASVQTELESARLEEEAADHALNAEASPEVHAGSGELTDGIDTEFERLVLEMEGARFSSERKTLMEKQTSEFLVNLRIEKMERTLIGDPVYRSGQSVHALIDGGPYVGVIKIPVSHDEKILAHKAGDEIQVWAKLVDFSPSLKRPVLEASEML
tara:strand:+ start:243 stop:1862 length:1620 start_codon:yes stop_codon:yes gene_type:complete